MSSANLSSVCIVSAHIPSLFQELVVGGSYWLIGPMHDDCKCKAKSNTLDHNNICSSGKTIPAAWLVAWQPSVLNTNRRQSICTAAH